MDIAISRYCFADDVSGIKLNLKHTRNSCCCFFSLMADGDELNEISEFSVTPGNLKSSRGTKKEAGVIQQQNQTDSSIAARARSTVQNNYSCSKNVVCCVCLTT